MDPRVLALVDGDMNLVNIDPAWIASDKPVTPIHG